MRLVILRPPDKWEETRRVCAAHGVEPVLVPLLHVREGASSELDAFTDAVLDGRADWVVFTGASGVQAVLDHAAQHGKDRSLITALSKCRVAAIGPRTDRALGNAGVTVDLVPDETNSQGLVQALADQALTGAHVEVPRSDRGTDVLRQGLERAGARVVHEFAAYTLTTADNQEVLTDALQLLRGGEATGILFTSALTAATFFELASEDGFGPDDLAQPGIIVGAIGEPTAKALRAAGVEPDVVPDTADLGLLIAAVQDAASKG